ncbi:MAG: ketoacyl-ACP synthase III [Actinomycetota bacterium]|nr:ketoacyl-ACP synthase III [Actinomycetota bacterium]
MRVTITGLGKAVPDRIVPNSELAERIGKSAEWMEIRTGIKERRYVSDDESTSSLGTRAALDALSVSGIEPEEVSLVVVATSTPDYRIPGTASIIQDAIGARSAGAFDVNAACSGFVYGLAVAASMVGSGASGPALVIGADVLSRHINFEDPLTAPLFGDGAGAVVVEADPEAEAMQFQLGSDGSGLHQVLIPRGGSRLTPDDANAPLRDKIKMSGREVFRNAVRIMTELGMAFGPDSFDLLVAHQANRRILDECAGQLGVDRSKVFMNIERYGNTSAASIPVALQEAWETGKLQSGYRLLMLAFGAGYTWAGAALRWKLPSPVSDEEAGAESLATVPA